MTGKARRVLVVEDSDPDRHLFRNWLRAESFEVHEAMDIITGLAACQKVRPDLILLQLRLPCWDGFEMIRRLKDDPVTRSIPVIILSAAATTAEKVRGFDMGAVDFVSKPFDPVELVARVRTALRTKDLLDLLEQRAHLDGLTGLGNRHAFQERLPSEWEACRRQGSALAVLIADLDHFKKINDLYGHSAGDDVLRQAALTLRHSVRSSDFVARYGGEEFVVIAPHCNFNNALAMAERFRAEVANLEIAFHDDPISVTSSVGIAFVVNVAQTDPLQLLAQADQALYHAKDAGRNAVWVWDGSSKSPIAASSLRYRDRAVKWGR